MIELEILVEVYDAYKEAEKKLSSLEFLKTDLIIDTYYYDPLRPNLKPDKNGKTFESFRIRHKNNKTKLTYKVDVYKNNIWQFSNENEMPINDFEQFKYILSKLGLKELVVIDNHRKYYKHEDYMVVLENVKGLGVFMEVEYKKTLQEKDVDSKRQEMISFIEKIGLNTSKELNSGKPELYIIRHNLTI